MNVFQAVGVRMRAGPVGLVLSRTATMAGMLVATSTQVLLASPLWLLLNQLARDRSIWVMWIGPLLFGSGLDEVR